MGLGEAMIVAGIGCRKGISAEEIGTALDTALERAGRPLARIELLATAERKREEEGIAAAAAARGLRVVFVDQADLEIASARGATWSRRVLALAGYRRSPKPRRLPPAGPRRGSFFRVSWWGLSLRARQRRGNAMTVHFIGAGPGAADLITLRDAT
jgi:cobalt-precorrin 5A hydrolase